MVIYVVSVYRYDRANLLSKRVVVAAGKVFAEFFLFLNELLRGDLLLLGSVFEFRGLIDNDLREGYADVVLVEEELELSVHIPFDLILRAFFAVSHETDNDGGITEFGNAFVERSVLDVGDGFFDLGKVLFEDGFHSFEGFAVFDADIADRERELVGHVDDIFKARVVDDLDVAAEVDYLGGADADLFDGAAETAVNDDVADVENAFEDDEETREYVGDKGLCAETDDETDDSDTCKDSRGINAASLKDEE